MKRFVVGICFIILGATLMSYGFIRIVQPDNAIKMTDAQVIERAKSLGMVELKDAIKSEQ